MPPLTPEQIALRRSFIGGSDAAAVCGVNPYRTAYQVYQEKIGEGKPVVETEAMYWGTIHEPAIARAFAERTGRVLTLSPETRIHPQFSFMGAHIDYLQDDSPRNNLAGVGEIKSTRRNLKKGECPDSYVIQLYHNLICTGLSWGTVAILIQGSELVWYDFHLTPQIERSIIEIETRFWKAVQAKDWTLFGVE